MTTLWDTLDGHQRTMAEFPELASVWPRFGAAWYRKWRELHLAKYPNVDQGTRRNLDMFVDFAEKREETQG